MALIISLLRLFSPRFCRCHVDGHSPLLPSPPIISPITSEKRTTTKTKGKQRAKRSAPRSLKKIFKSLAASSKDWRKISVPVAADKDIAGTYGMTSGGHHADGCYVLLFTRLGPSSPKNLSSFDGKIDHRQRQQYPLKTLRRFWTSTVSQSTT